MAAKKTNNGWDAYVGTRYIGTYSTDKLALAAAKKADLQRRDEKARAKAAAQKTWVCIRGRMVRA